MPRPVINASGGAILGGDDAARVNSTPQKNTSGGGYYGPHQQQCDCQSAYACVYRQHALELPDCMKGRKNYEERKKWERHPEEEEEAERQPDSLQSVRCLGWSPPNDC